MNGHLELVFKKILSALEKSGIEYWVYGGVAIAGVKGIFYRHNDDVDIFVLDEDYQQILRVIEGLNFNWIKPKPRKALKDIRPKTDYFISGQEKEVFSVIPIYKIDNNKVKFVYKVDLIPVSPLTREKKIIHDYIFYTPSPEFIKEQFIHKIKGKLIKEIELSENEQKDAEVLFGPNYFQIITTERK